MHTFYYNNYCDYTFCTILIKVDYESFSYIW